VRAFLAVAVAPPALDAVGDTLARLREDVARVRWVHSDTVHITLHFFAHMVEEDVARVMDATVSAVQHATPFEVRLGPYGSFSDRGTPRVLWLGVADGRTDLGVLAATCEDALSQAGFAREPRPFAAHCTIGRPRTPWPDEARRAWSAALAPPLPQFVADRVTLFESVPRRGGTEYVVLGVAPFGARG
jgi:2'-5' RNA ligase